MTYESLDTVIRHKVAIPKEYSGHLADIELDITAMLGDDPMAQYALDDVQIQTLFANLPLIHHNESKLFYVFKGICLLIFGLIFAYVALMSGLKAFNHPLFVIPVLFFGYLTILILFKELPNKFKSYDNQIDVKVYQNHLEFKPQNALGHLSQTFNTIDFDDVYSVAYEYVKLGKHDYLPAGQNNYWAVNVYYLTYGPDKKFYKKNVIELMTSQYADKTHKQFAIWLYQLWQCHQTGKDNTQLPQIHYIKQLTFEEFARRNNPI